MHLGDLARGCFDLEMTWLLCCAGAANDVTTFWRDGDGRLAISLEHYRLSHRLKTICFIDKIEVRL